MIEKIETLIVERLQRGLGRLCRSVGSYGGELDGDIGHALRALPAVWVTYGGSSISTKGIAARRHQNTAKYAVMVATRSVRDEQSARRGGVDSREIGSYTLIAAVRRLLDGQGLNAGLAYGLQPKNVRSIFNHQSVGGSQLSVFAIEYEAVWNDAEPLQDGRYPVQTTDTANPDHVFTTYAGELSPPDADLLTLGGRIFDPSNSAENPINLYLRGQNETN